jgi:uncharacterized protein YoxC
MRLCKQLDELIAGQHRIERKLTRIMTAVQIEQEELDSIASTVSDVADTLQGIIDSETTLAPADESALTAAVEKLQGVGPKVTPSE